MLFYKISSFSDGGCTSTVQKMLFPDSSLVYAWFDLCKFIVLYA